MASLSVGTAGGGSAGLKLVTAVAAEGSAAHSYALGGLEAGPSAARNLSDFLHFLCALHGRYPGVVDHAAERVNDAGARAWLSEAAEAFAGERLCMARLVAAAGPVPSTPGAADSDAVVRAQRHAIEMLAQSEREGCPLGAAMAVVLDWAVVRRSLETSAQRFGIEIPAFAAFAPEEAAQVADRFAASPSAQRALLFGAQQILAQHYGLWDLLEARALAREGR
jgi:hypothetical protein